jgi:hypothetical protein
MNYPIVRLDESPFERIREAILNRDDADDQKPTGPGAPTPG